jgi:hypothetical protein
MKIQIVCNSTEELDKYLLKLFSLLEEDKNFEQLVTKTRELFDISTPVLEGKMTSVIYQKRRISKLRSESSKSLISGRYQDNVKINNDKNLISEQINNIIKEYPYLAEWKDGLIGFLLTNNFVINENEPIRLKIKTSGRSYFGHYTDGGEDGVRLLLTSKVSAKELKNWFTKYKKEIWSFIDQMKATSKVKPTQSFYYRDLLIAYMKEKLGYSYSRIDEKVGDDSGTKAMELAYDDYKKSTS